MMAISDNVLLESEFTKYGLSLSNAISYLNLNLEIDSGIWLITKLFDKI
jgi:hypothetical protein